MGKQPDRSVLLPWMGQLTGITARNYACWHHAAHATVLARQPVRAGITQPSCSRCGCTPVHSTALSRGATATQTLGQTGVRALKSRPSELIQFSQVLNGSPSVCAGGTPASWTQQVQFTESGDHAWPIITPPCRRNLPGISTLPLMRQQFTGQSIPQQSV